MDKYLIRVETSDTDFQEVVRAKAPAKDLGDFEDDWEVCHHKISSMFSPENPGPPVYDNVEEGMYAEMRLLGWEIEIVKTHGTFVLPQDTTEKE